MSDYLKRKTIKNLVYFYASELKRLQEKKVYSKFFTTSERRTFTRNGILTHEGTYPRVNVLTDRAQKILDKLWKGY